MNLRFARWAHVLCLTLAVWWLGACREAEKPPPNRSTTTAELRVVRRGLSVEHPGEKPRAPYPRERLGEDAIVVIEEGGLGWLRRDGGTTLLVRGPAKLRVGKTALRLEAGRAFAETPEGRAEQLDTPAGLLVLSAVRASVEVSAERTEVYVLEGELRRGELVARAGERLVLQGKEGKVSPELAWEDWTGGLATTDRQSEPAPFGVGTVGARRPGSVEAHEALGVRRLDVRVSIQGDLATTEIDQEFFNPHSEIVEGQYRFRVPEGALLERFGVDRDGGVLFGYVKEKQAAAAQYAANVARGEDPAVLAWRGPGEYEAKLFPIAPGATRRVVVRYTEWLSRTGARGERRLYVYPMAFEGSEASAPHIEDYSIEIDLEEAGAKEVRAGMDAVRTGQLLVVRGHDLVPRADLAVELYDDGPKTAVAAVAAHKADLVALGPAEVRDARRSTSGEAGYVLVPVRAGVLPERKLGIDLVIVVDSSAGTDPANLSLARAATRALLTHLGPTDRAVVLAGDDRLRPVAEGLDGLAAVGRAESELVQRGLAAVTPGGASDLGAMLSEAAGKTSEDRETAVIYIGDGRPTVGELDTQSIRARLAKLPRPVRMFALGTGESADLALLESLARGGLAMRISDVRGAARSALEVLERVERGAELGATVDLGPGVERVYPRELGALTEGETTLVVGRLSGEVPKELRVKTQRGESVLPIERVEIDDHGDLRRRWANGRLAEMLASGEGRAALVDLGVRQGIVTPVTSLYVPTSAEMTTAQKQQIERGKRTRAVLPKAKPKEEPEEQSPKRGFFDGLLSGDKSMPAASEPERAEANADNKEGGTGTRARGEEGSMGKGSPVSAAATAEPAAAVPTDQAPMPAAAPSAPAEQEKRRELDFDDEVAAAEPKPDSGLERSKPSPRNELADALSPAQSAPGSPPPPPAKTETATGLGNIGTIGHGAGAGGLAGGRLSGQHATGGARVRGGDMTIDGELVDGKRDSAEGWLEQRDGRLRLVVDIDDPGRIRRPCSKAADLPFAERQRLWAERLSPLAGQAHAMHVSYLAAIRSCELPTSRERKAFMRIAISLLPEVHTKVALYRRLVSEPAIADAVYRSILARVITQDDLRALSAALGLATVDPLELEAALAKATTAQERASVLVRLAARYPDDRSLQLSLLDTLEDAGDEGAALALARKLLRRSDADARVRTAVGELYLRLAKRASATPAERDQLERDAKRAFGELVEFSPEDPVARRRLGDLLRAHGYHTEAQRQYETLAKLSPDDPSVSLLLASAAEGLGKLEEAVRWTEKGAKAGSPDASQGPHVTARALAATFLAWGRLEARRDGKKDELEALGARLARVMADERREGGTRIVLSWSHPDLHPSLWTDASGRMGPAPEGDPTMGVAQAIAGQGPVRIEVRVERGELEAAARLGAEAVLTVVSDEGTEAEVIHREKLVFARSGPTPVLLLEGKALRRVEADTGAVEPARVPTQGGRGAGR
jgi:Flp pilus assembly protein TadD